MIDATMMFPMAAILGIGFLVASEAATRPSEASLNVALDRSGVTPDLSACWGGLSEDASTARDCSRSSLAERSVRAELSALSVFPTGLIAS